MTKRVAILISGTGSTMASLVTAMGDDLDCEPVLVICNRPEAAGVGRARALGVPVAVVDHTSGGRDRPAFEAAMGEFLDAADPDILCLAGFMRVLSPGFVHRWSGKMLNVHPSLLPAYPGLHTHRRVLEAGDAEHGASVHEVTPEVDGGPILGQARISVHAGDTEDSLAERLRPVEHDLYAQVLGRFARGDRSLLHLDHTDVAGPGTRKDDDAT